MAESGTAPAQMPANSTATVVRIHSATGAKPFSAIAGQVALGHEVVAPGTSTFRAFVSTNSLSPLIFATLAETQGVGKITVFCGPRHYGSDDRVLITLFTEGAVPPTALVIVTIMQDGATMYGQPIY